MSATNVMMDRVFKSLRWYYQHQLAPDVPERNPVPSLVPHYNTAYIYRGKESQQIGWREIRLGSVWTSNPITPLVQRSGFLEARGHNIWDLGLWQLQPERFQFCLLLLYSFRNFCYFVISYQNAIPMSHVHFTGLRRCQNGVFHLDATY